MERGVVVGGLMICGSFLLAALLNRSAMEEVPEPATTESLPAVSLSSGPREAQSLAGCATVEERVGSRRVVAPAESSRAGSDLAATSADDVRVTVTNDLTATPNDDLTVTPTNDLAVTPTNDLTVTPTDDLAVTSTDHLAVTPTDDLTVNGRGPCPP